MFQHCITHSWIQLGEKETLSAFQQSLLSTIWNRNKGALRGKKTLQTCSWIYCNAKLHVSKLSKDIHRFCDKVFTIYLNNAKPKEHEERLVNFNQSRADGAEAMRQFSWIWSPSLNSTSSQYDLTYHTICMMCAPKSNNDKAVGRGQDGLVWVWPIFASRHWKIKAGFNVLQSALKLQL